VAHKRYRPEHRALYNHPAWQPLRKAVFLRDGYVCQWPGCGKPLIGKGNAPDAPVAHHKRDHKGDLKLFLDKQNIMATCKECHDGAIQRATHRGYIAGHDENGRPIDPDHPWNRSAP
jgi:5-methylcytosine-specific restriction endonuclease McrA